MIFHFKMAQNLVAEHYGRYFDMIFYFLTAQSLFAEHAEKYFDMIYHFLVALYLVAEHLKEDMLTDLSPMTMNKNRLS